jgi:hypothetical protein
VQEESENSVKIGKSHFEFRFAVRNAPTEPVHECWLRCGSSIGFVTNFSWPTIFAGTHIALFVRPLPEYYLVAQALDNGESNLPLSLPTPILSSDSDRTCQDSVNLFLDKFISDFGIPTLNEKAVTLPGIADAKVLYALYSEAFSKGLLDPEVHLLIASFLYCFVMQN